MKVAYREARPRCDGQLGRPSATVLLVVAGLVTATTPFDSAFGLDIQFLRNPSAAFGILLVILFLGLTRGRFSLTHRSQIWALIFVVVLAVLELARLVLADVFSPVGAPTLTSLAVWYLTFAQPIVLFLIVSIISRDRRAVGVILQGFPLVMGALALGGIAVAGSSRWAPLGLNENAAGMAFGMATVIATAVLLRVSPRIVPALTVAIAVSIPLNVIGLLVSGSRGASAAALVALAVLVVLTPTKLRRMLVLVSTMVVFTFASSAYLQGASALLVTRWQSAIDGTQLGARDELIAVSYSLFTESPIWGYGPQANRFVGTRFYAARGRSTEAAFSPHNTLFALLLPLGVIGTFPWIGMVLTVARGTWNQRRHPNAPMLLALLTLFFVYTISGSIVGNKLFYVVLGLAAGLRPWGGAQATGPSFVHRSELLKPER